MKKIKNNSVIFCAGMTQSGSTAFWNLIKFIFDEFSIKYDYCIIPSFDNMNRASKPPRINYKDFSKYRENQTKPMISKIHGMVDLSIKENDFVFLSTRDLFQSTISARKKSRGLSDRKIIDRNLKIYDDWKPLASYVVEFDYLVNNQEKLIEDVCSVFNLDVTKKEIKNIKNKLNNIPTNQYNKYLLTPRHIQSNYKFYHDLSDIPYSTKKYLDSIKEKKEYEGLFV